MLNDSAVMVSGVLRLHQILSFRTSVGRQVFVVVIVVDELMMHLLYVDGIY